MTTNYVNVDINLGAIEAIHSNIPLGNLSTRSLKDKNGVIIPFYTMMKRNPTLPAQIIKTHFNTYIRSPAFARVKTREFFWIYMKILTKKSKQNVFLGLMSDTGIQTAEENLNLLLKLAQDGIMPAWRAAFQIRRPLILMEMELVMAKLIKADDFIPEIEDLNRQTNNMYFDFIYDYKVKRCHNPTCDNISTNQCSCRETRYCSAACQLADWKRHKKTCQFIKK